MFSHLEKRSSWLLLAAAVAILALAPSAVAQGPVPGPDSSTTPAHAPDGEHSMFPDGDDTLEFGIEAVWDYQGTTDDRPNGHLTAVGLRNTLLFPYLPGKWSWGAGYDSFFRENADAWEEHWKRYSKGGTNNSWIDSVDFAFYLGHGDPYSFSFDTPDGWGTHDDSDLTTFDAYTAWGEKDLEWAGLLSCAVLADPNLVSWAATMNGIHLLMGFKTNASAEYPSFGSAVGIRLRSNDTVSGAWWYACDTQQPAGKVARILAEDVTYFGEKPYGPLYADTWDYTKYLADHDCGSEDARQAAPLAGNTMPVFLTPPLSLDEAAAEWYTLTTAFELPAQSTRVMATTQVSGTDASGRELMMDPDSGLFYYIDHNNLYTITSQTMSAQSASIAPGDAQAIATYFLTSTGLMPADAQFYEVAANSIAQMTLTIGEKGAPSDLQQVGATVTTDYSVIFSRIVTHSTMVNGVQAVQAYSVGGPGAKMKVYVDPAGAAYSRSGVAAAASDVIGAQGGWRRVDNGPQVPGVQATSVATVPILGLPEISQLFQELEPTVALDAVAVPADIGRTILTHTVMYWEEPTGAGQDQLFPAYDLTVQYVGTKQNGTVTTTAHSYIPAASTFMRPYARIESSSNTSVNYVAGQVFTATAANAELTLTQLGHPGLDFPLGFGPFLYSWYIDRSGELTAIGTGRNLTWTIDLDKLSLGWGVPAHQTLMLQVDDAGTPHTSQRSNLATLYFDVIPPIYLPLVVRM